MVDNGAHLFAAGIRRLAHRAPAAALVLLLASASPAAVQPCPANRNCALIAVDGPRTRVGVGDTGIATVRFQQALDDSAPGGADEIAGVVFTMAIPGLQLASCDGPDANGLTSAFTLPPAAAGLWVLATNTTCRNRTSCLCPDAGQPRDEYVDLVIARLPSGDAPLAPLPSDDLLSVALRVTDSANPTVVLHVFNGSDQTPPPSGAAPLSIADVNAVDVTVDADAGVANVRVADGELLTTNSPVTPTAPATLTATPVATNTVAATPTVTSSAGATATAIATATASATAPASATPVDTPTPLPPACVGDCDGSRSVSVNELVVGVSIVLGSAPLDRCPAIDCHGDGNVSINCLVAAVNAALSGCGG